MAALMAVATKRKTGRPSETERWRPVVKGLLQEAPTLPVLDVFRRLQAEHGYEGGRSAIYDLVDRVRRSSRGIKIVKVCPIENCTTPPRPPESWSLAKKRANDHRRVPGSEHEYYVPCRLHEDETQAELLKEHEADLRGRLFTRLFTAKYPDGYMYRGRKHSAADFLMAIRTNFPAGLAMVARRVRKELYAEEYRDSSLRIHHTFLRRYKERFPDVDHGENVWDRAKRGDADALKMRAQVLGPEDEAFVCERQSRRPSTPRLASDAVTRRGKAIAAGQVVHRAERVKGLHPCRLCWMAVHRQRYHEDCLDTWRATAEFNAERERCRGVRRKTARRPIDPPLPRGPRPNLDQKYVWAMMRARGKTPTEIANEFRTTAEVVIIGIHDLFKRLPASGWGEVFYDRGNPTANEAREKNLPLKGRRIPDSERPERDRCALRLDRYGMPLEKIAKLVGYEIEEVARITGKSIENTPQRADIGRREDLEVITAAGRLLVSQHRPHVVTLNGSPVHRGSRPVVLSRRQYELLAQMAMRPGQAIPAADLATSVWRRDNATAVLKATVSDLREKLGDGVISTTRNGYRLGEPRPDEPDEVERRQLLRVLTGVEGNLSRAATELGIPRSTLHYRVGRAVRKTGPGRR